MNWIETYKFQLLFIIATLGLLTTYTLYMKRDVEINQLRKDNETLREYVVTLHERIELLDNYPYEHSKIENNDRNSDSPKHNDIGDCIKYRQCGCTCSDGKGTTKATTKESTNIRYSRSVPF
jgi:hypothetical protein